MDLKEQAWRHSEMTCGRGWGGVGRMNVLRPWHSSLLPDQKEEAFFCCELDDGGEGVLMARAGQAARVVSLLGRQEMAGTLDSASSSP